MAENETRKLTFGGIEFVPDSALEPGTIYLIAVRSEWERFRLRHLLGKDFVESVVIEGLQHDRDDPRPVEPHPLGGP
jgi:hypothetical protein